MTRWGMVIDVRKCIGCENCKHVCNDANHVPPGATWRRVVSFMKDKRLDRSEELSMSCMHCSHPPCLDVCPTGATYQRPDGIVDIKSERCIGCGACILACPYKARSIVFEDVITRTRIDLKKQQNPEYGHRVGTCTKCDFCRSRLEKGLEKGLQPGFDSEASPICVRNCIGEALYFGDLDDPESEVSILIRNNKTVQLNEEFKTNPSVFYILD